MKKRIKMILIKIPIIKLVLKLRDEKRKFRDYSKLLKKTPPIFVYQMGKVASSSAYYSIKNQYSGACLHAHSFSETHHDFYVRALFEIYQKEKLPIKIITMVREPISRNISAFFENFERDTGTSYEHSNYSIKELRDLFLTNYKHEIPIVWFDENIKNHFGIDIYKSNFPEIGFQVYKKDNVDLLLYKHDIEDSIKERIIEDFIGIKNFKLSNTNIGNKKVYSSTYKKFKKLNLPDYYLDEMLNSKYSNHFYSNDLNGIRNKWNEK